MVVVSAYTWGFRNRIRLVGGNKIGLPATRLDLSAQSKVYVETPDQSVAIRDSDQLILRGGGYETSADALAAGEHWIAVCARAFARIGLPADFGSRRAVGVLTDAGREHLSRDLGVPVIGEAAGLQVFHEVPDLRFATVEMTPTVTRGGTSVRGTLAASAALAVMPPRYTEAFEIWSSAQAIESIDARFVMLMVSLETLTEAKPRSDEVRLLVAELAQRVAESTVSTNEKKSILSSLSWLRQQSIGQAARELLAVALPNQRYEGESATSLFSSCYEVRSSLAHGSRPQVDKVRQYEGPLRQLVQDLLQGELLTTLPEYPGDGDAGDTWLQATGADVQQEFVPQPKAVAPGGVYTRARRRLSVVLRRCADIFDVT